MVVAGEDVVAVGAFVWASCAVAHVRLAVVSGSVAAGLAEGCPVGG